VKKITVILISIALVLAFAVIVFFGLRYARGTPVIIEGPADPVVLAVEYIDTEINLDEGLGMEVWGNLEPREIELIHQVMVVPWSKSLMSPLHVKAFHNNSDIYFFMSWKDGTEDNIVDIGKFSDGSAIMFPLDDDVQPSTLLMGFMGGANIWHWKASNDIEYWSEEILEYETYIDFYYPFEEEELFIVSKETLGSAVNDLISERVATLAPKQNQTVQGRGIYENGTWSVVFKRPMNIEDPEVELVLDDGQEKLIAFALWNGSNGDRGGRKSISDWVELSIE